MEIVKISVHARPIRGTRGRCFLPVRYVIIEPRPVTETLSSLDDQQLVFMKVKPAGRKRVAKHQAKN